MKERLSCDGSEGFRKVGHDGSQTSAETAS
jgi:hypothetical protein